MTIATEAGHWYTRDGEPAYTIIGSNGIERNTTLRDARKLNLVPSVSGIIGCAAAPQLEWWKTDRHLDVAAVMPLEDVERLDEWRSRVRAATKEQLDKAPDLGTIIHKCIEKWLCSEQYDPGYDQHVYGATFSLKDWCGLDTLRPERSFCHPLGFGGKCDVHKKPAIDLKETHSGFVADFKSKDFTADKLPDVYENHAMQLAAYREGFDMPAARGAIIYVSTAVPGLTHLVEVEESELSRGWEMFKALLNYWKWKNRHALPEELAA